MRKIKNKLIRAKKNQIFFQGKNFILLNFYSKFRKLNDYVKGISLKTTLSIGIIVLTALPLDAANIPLISKKVAIPRGKSLTLGFGTVRQKNTTVLLRVTSRLNTSTQGGSAAILKILINGKEIRTSRTRHGVRLINRSLVSPITPSKSGSWFHDHPKFGSGWRLLYAPNFKRSPKQSFYKGDPYTLILDVTDLINPAGANEVKLVNLCTKKWTWLKKNDGELIVQTLNISTKPVASPMMLPDVNVKPFINRGQPAAGPAKYRGKIMPGGGFAITIGQRRWDFASAFSYPNAGLNHLLPSSKTKGQSRWKVRVKLRDDGGDVFATGSHYRLHRSVRFTSRKVEIKDTLTNRHSSSPLGLLVRHEGTLKGIETASVRIAGNPAPSVKEYYSPPNPSVHVSLPDQSVGILCEDDVFRNQARLFATSSTFGIRTEMLRLGPGETYSLEWSVYPVAGPDYFDFINLVREDWGANFMVDGPWTVIYPDRTLARSVDKLREQFAHHGIKYAISCGPWEEKVDGNVRLAFGMGGLDNMWTNYRRKLRKAVARVRKAAPQVKILFYYDSRRDTSKGSKEQFSDSWWTDSNGNQLFTTFGYLGNICYSVVATLKNSFGRKMLASVDRLLNESGSDGIYWDEMSGPDSFGIPGITYNQFDGNSCLLDLNKYTIKHEIGITSLLTKSFQVAVINHMRKAGRPIMGNAPICTRAVLATRMPIMTEIQHNEYWCYESNLGSPMGWTYVSPSFAGMTRSLRLACLPVGVPLSATHEISRYLFPFTTIELHYGYLLGKERIIVLHDGNYGWVGKRCLVQLRHFNSAGKLIKDDSFTLIGTEARTAIKLAKEEAMVLVRLPISFEPDNKETSKWNAEVQKVNYDANLISLYLKAPQGGILKIDSGKFSLKDAPFVKVRLGNESQSVKVVNSTLRITVPAKFYGNITIKQ